jgi:tryptophanyl-tRNA synthetase
VLAELAPIRARAQEFINAPEQVRDIIAAGCEQARAVAGETMQEVRQALGLVDII